MNNRRLFSSITIKIIFIVGSLIFISQVYSYSSASISNDGKVSFLSSENALIAMPEDIVVEIGYSLDDLFIDSFADTTKYAMEVIDSNFAIKNNTEYIMTIDCYINHPNNGIFIENNQNIKTIFPGESYQVDFLLDENIMIGESRYTALIYAHWENGSAKIEKDFVINIETYPEIFMNIPSTKETVNNEAVSEPEELVFEKPGIEYDSNSEISKDNNTETTEKSQTQISESESSSIPEDSEQIIENAINESGEI